MGTWNGQRGNGSAIKTNTPANKVQAHPLSAVVPKDDLFPLIRFLALIGAIGMLVIAMIVYSAQTGLRMSQRYTPLIDAAMEIKQEATIGHLWFEEILSNDVNEDIDTVRAHLQQADWYARVMLEGGQNAHSTFIPLDDPQLRSYIREVRELLTLFRSQMEDRWLHQEISGPGTAVDQSFDDTFNKFIAKANIVVTRLKQLIVDAERRFINVQVTLGLVTIAVMVVMGLLVKRFAERQNRSLAALKREISHRKGIESTLRELATTDPLTGLLNRRSISDLLQDELQRAARMETSFSIIMFDIDHFKKVNDTHGHAVGDEVLKSVADTVKSRLREVDALARWGGEEFLVVLPGTDLEGALSLSNICRAILANGHIKDVGCITASFGVAQHQTGETTRGLLHRADDALYLAKNGGRNRVEASAA
ncbi:MAG: GGDEF domain-containing protein [Magnetovibrio sp.]|nr:GGDEF domain-containing protein [Magnetovibrio sp.]